MSSNDYETECVSSDVIKHRRQERGGLKAALTLKMRKIKDLMSVQNVAEVETTLHEIRNSMSNLFIKNDELIKAAFSDPSEIALAKKYMDEVETDYNKLTDDVNAWLTNRLGTPDEIKPGDSASQTGKSNVSTSSSRVKLKAKKAALLAKAQLLERQQEFKRKQAELELAQEKLTLECEIKATDAEERVYEEFELGVIEKTFDVPVPEMRNLDESNKTVEQRPIRSPLNPFAQPWSGRREAGQMTENLDTMNRFQCDLTEPRQVIQGESSSILMMQQKMLDAVQLPRSELIRFDGDPLKYWMFIRSFESHVGQTSVGSSAKLNRLLSYCTGKALSVIECCSVMEPDEGYTEALSLLNSRFGNHHVISNAWVDKVTGGPWLRPGDNEGLRRYADDLRSAMLTLKAMGKVNEIDNQVRMVKIVSKLPNYLQSRWRRKVIECLSLKGEYPKIDALVSFVKQAADEANDPVFGMMSGSRHKDENLRNWPRGFDKKGANYNVQASERVRDQSFFKSPSCPMCSGGHALFMCERFRNMRPEMRHDFVVDKRLCFNCFYDNHLARDCRKPSKCHIQGCTRKHSRLIHLPLRSEGIYQRRTDTRSSELPKLENPFEAQSSNVSSRMSRVALPVVRVQVSAGNGGKRMWTYALLDSGSTNSFCSNTLLDKLGVEVSETELSLTTLEKVNSKAHTRMTSLFVTDADNRTTLEMPHVFGTANLSANVNEPVDEQNVDLWNHLKGLKFPCVNKVNVGLLIGQDVPTALTPVDVRTGSTNEPYTVKTALGWVLNGPMADVRSYEVMTHYACTDQSLEAQVERFWKIDTCDPLATNARGISVEDKRTLTIWDNSARVVDGHYELSIPFKSNPPCLQNNFSVAESRLDSLKRRFMKDNKLFEKYRNGIKELVDKGFAEKVQEIDVNRSGQGAWYIPHHAVVNEHKPEKLRVVFDCSAKYCGTSLNEQVYQGPDLTNKLMGVLLRFREGPIGVMGDIDAMFHQVKVPELDRDYLRFLWFSDTGQHPDVFPMTVHLFGGVWSPSCASYALRRTAEDNKAAFDSDVVQTVLDNFYVDDCLRSLQGEHEAIQLIQRLCGLLSRGGFSLNKWITNNRTVLSSIPEERRAKTVKGIHLCGDKLPAERALGVLWDTEKDEFGFRIAVKSRPMTRRGMLSIIGSVYDPLGLVSPFVLQAKEIFQSESRMRKGWDEHLSQTNSEKWIKWLSDLPKLEMCRFPRCMSSSSCPESTKYELHHFSDASCEGYGAVSYLREVNDDGSIHCDLITSKSRLAPLKQMTIPRLELSAAVISVKLDVMLRCELKLPVDKSVFWTDSTVVIQYIKNESKRFHLFVANRIALIRDSSEPNQWKHVDSANNPADDVSRGLDADQMVSSVRWKHGPKFLSQPDSEWSILDVDMKISDSDKEVKRETKVYSVATNESCDLLDELFKRYSSWYRLKRSVAWLLRLKQILMNKAHRRKYSIPDSGLTVRIEESRAFYCSSVAKENVQ